MIFFIIMVLLALGAIFFVRQDLYPETGGLFLGPGTDSNNNSSGNGFVPFDLGAPASSPVKVNTVEVYFCPQDECADKLVAKINSAEKTMYIAIYSFTEDSIASAVLSAKQRGVDVKIIFDYDQSTNAYSDDEKLIEAGVSVARRNGSGYMHNKFAIIDGNIVATGSFNYSQNADTRNEENLVFIASEEVASKFKSDFDKIWDSSVKTN